MKLRLFATLAGVILTSCDSPIDPPTMGHLQVVAFAHNLDPDPDGFIVYIDDDSVGVVQNNSMTQFALTRGAHIVRLGDVAHNCMPQHPQLTAQVGADTTKLTFDFECQRTLANKVLFTSFRDGQWRLYAVRYDGSNLHEVDVGVPTMGAAVFPDGKRLAFLSAGTLYVAQADGSAAKPLPLRINTLAVRISHDGGRIAYVHDNNVYVSDSTGAQIKQLTNSFDWKAYPSWSPDDQQIAYASYGGIYAVSALGGSPTVMTRGFNDPNMPAWNSDGWISFSDARNTDTSWKIYSVNAATGDIRKESIGQDEEIVPAWSDNGEWLAFMSDRSPVWNIYVQRRDGTLRRRLTDGRHEATQPFFGPHLPE